MKTQSCIYLLFCFTLSCRAMSIDLTKESAGGEKITDLNHKIKRSVDELDSLLNEIISNDEEKLQNSPLLQYLLFRKPSLVSEKRSIDYRPRMGRRSTENDQQKPYEPKPYDVFFTPRMGKRSEIFTSKPSFGRSIFSE